MLQEAGSGVAAPGYLLCWLALSSVSTPLCHLWHGPSVTGLVMLRVFVSWDVYVFEGAGGRERGGSQAASLLCLGPGARREGLTIPLSFAFPFSLPRV